MLLAFRRVLDRQADIRLKIVSDASLAPYSGLIRDLGLQDHLDLVRADYFQLPQQLQSAMIALSPESLPASPAKC